MRPKFVLMFMAVVACVAVAVYLALSGSGGRAAPAAERRVPPTGLPGVPLPVIRAPAPLTRPFDIRAESHWCGGDALPFPATYQSEGELAPWHHPSARNAFTIHRKDEGGFSLVATGYPGHSLEIESASLSDDCRVLSYTLTSTDKQHAVYGIRTWFKVEFDPDFRSATMTGGNDGGVTRTTQHRLVLAQ